MYIMSDLEKLNISTPFIDELKIESEYVDISKYKHLRVTIFADILINVELIFSHDGILDGPVTLYKINNTWNTRKVDIILKYIKIRLSRDSVDSVNKLIVCNVIGRHGENEGVKEPEVEKRHKSPFKSILSRKKSSGSLNVSSKVECSDSRLPALIPRNGLLLGGYSNSVINVVPPLADCDYILVSRSGIIQWESLEVEDKHVSFYQ